MTHGKLFRALTILLVFPALSALFAPRIEAQGTQEPLTISDLKVTNHIGTAFVLSWRTNRPTVSNLVRYGKDHSNLNLVAEDVTSINKPTTVHFVQLTYLDVNSTYFYRVESDGLVYSVSEAGVDSVRTFPQVFVSLNVLLQGQVIDQESRAPIERVMARAFLKTIRQSGGNTLIDSTMWFTSLTNASGYFVYQVENFRRYNGQAPQYIAGSTWLHLDILGPVQGSVRDSVLLTATNYQSQLLPTYELIDERRKALRGRISATSPVLSNGRSASVVWVTVLDSAGRAVPNVDIRLKASPEQGVTYLQPQQPTDSEGRTWGLVRSVVSGDVIIMALNVTNPDSAALDSVAIVSFVDPPGDITQDKSPPFIYFTTDHGNTTNNAGPYTIRTNVVDNFTPQVSLVWTVSGTVFTDTLSMTNTPETDEFRANIPGQAYNSVVNYFVLAGDSAGFRVSDPDSFISDPFVLPYRFEVQPPGGTGIAQMGITRTTDLFDRTDTRMPVRVDTWVTTTAGIRSAVIKYRNLTQGTTFFDIPLNRFGSRCWGWIPAQPSGSRMEYFIQVVDSLGRVDTDNRRAPLADLYRYEVLEPGPRSEAVYADTSAVIGTQDVRHSRQVVIADLNGDTYPDVVVANYNETNSVYFYNPVAGRLEDVTLQALGVQQSERTTSVVAVDVDGDDDLDLIFANEGQRNRIYINNGQGRFDDVTFRVVDGNPRMPEETWSSVMLLADDFNGNGSIDLFVVNNSLGGEQNRLLFNNGKGVFTDASQYMLTPPADQSVWAIAGDVDGDGDTDIVVINRAQNHIVWLNSGKGVFQRREITAASAAQAQGGELVDVDGDGDLDLVVAQMNTQQNELFMNNGTGIFTRDTQGRLTAESDNTWGVKAFDANLDGFPDLLYLNSGQANRLLLNNGSGYFSNAPAGMMPLGSSYTTSAAVGDLNRNNRPDIYLTEQFQRNTLLMSRTRLVRPEDLPSAFSLLAPGRMDTVNSTTVAFRWRSSRSTDSTDAVRYSFELSRDSLFTAGQLITKLDNLTDTTVTVQSLTDNTRYWWRVSARNASQVPVYAGTYSFRVMTSYTGGAPEFLVMLNRNPVLSGYMNIYIISSEPLSAAPQLNVNLAPVQVSRIGQNDIWRGQYLARSGFLLSVTGVNLAGRVGEFVKTYSSILASADGSRYSDLPARVELSPGSENSAVGMLVEHNPPVGEKLKRRVESLGLAGVDVSPAALETESWTFTAFDGAVAGPWRVILRGRDGSSSGPDAAVCRLDNGQWRPLMTFHDKASNVYSAVSEDLGTFALLSGAGTARSVLPRAFTLSQNVPNPFNPSTTISYIVPEETAGGRVSIRVYNLRGALVRSLVDRDHQPGVYAVEWDGRDESGRDLPSGVYFYRLKAETAAISRKMVLIR